MVLNTKGASNALIFQVVSKHYGPTDGQTDLIEMRGVRILQRGTFCLKRFRVRGGTTDGPDRRTDPLIENAYRNQMVLNMAIVEDETRDFHSCHSQYDQTLTRFREREISASFNEGKSNVEDHDADEDKPGRHWNGMRSPH